MYTLKLSPTHFVGSKSATGNSSATATALDPTALLSTLSALQKDEREQPLSSLANHHPALSFSSHSLRDAATAPKPKATMNGDEDDALDASSVALPHCLPFRPALSSSSSSSPAATKLPSALDESGNTETAEKKRKRKKKNKTNSKENGEDRSVSPQHNGQQQRHENGASDTDSDRATSPAAPQPSTPATAQTTTSSAPSSSQSAHQNGANKSANKAQKKKSSPSSASVSSSSDDSLIVSLPVASLRALFQISLQSALENVFNTVDESQQKLRLSNGNNAPPVLTAKVKKELLRKAESQMLDKLMKNVKHAAAKAERATVPASPTTTASESTSQTTVNASV